MGTILASALISEMREVLFDTVVPYRWSDKSFLTKLNNAQRFIVQHVPKANVVNDAFKLSAGVVQSIPAGGNELVSLDFNMGTDGLTIGAPIRIITIEDLTSLIPDWTTATASSIVQYFMFNEKDPSHFYVYPPQPASDQGYVKGPYSANPTDIASTDTAITLSDIFSNPMKMFALYETLRLETDALALQQAVGYYNACVMEIGRKDLVMKTYNPNRKQENQ
jgi:hypothetical protein